VPSRFDLILFDADGTLLDFAASERVAFQACMQAHARAERCDEIYRVYTEVGAPLWRELEAGVITLIELRDRRWTELAQRCGLAYEVAEISLAYVEELKRHSHTIAGAAEVCRSLAQTHQLGVVTNGFQEIQVARFAGAALSPYLDFLVSSEAAGAHKPARAIFDRALALAGRPLSPERVLMVGDNFGSDIVGAQRMGFSTCWFNPSGSPAQRAEELARGRAVDLEITDLRELLAIAG
jgi:YjjG family noncanonical pyrimidine nucleotidase